MKTKQFIYLIISTFLVVLFACEGKKIDSRKFANEMKQRVPKRVTEGQIMAEALTKGAMMVSKVEDEIKFKTLELSKTNPEKAAQWCNEALYPVKDSLSMVYNTTIERLILKDTLLRGFVENELLKAYLYASQNKYPLESNLQNLKDGFILYSSPIVLNSEPCNSCHQVGAKLNTQMKTLYPKSTVFNYKKGDLMGMWSVKISQKDLIIKMK